MDAGSGLDTEGADELRIIGREISERIPRCYRCLAKVDETRIHECSPSLDAVVPVIGDKESARAKICQQ
jgi:hypothetical protein